MSGQQGAGDQCITNSLVVPPHLDDADVSSQSASLEIDLSTTPIAHRFGDVFIRLSLSATAVRVR